ncbi:MAG: RNA polymerase factor sigma-54 [Alphaproteobacteria bacterium]|nr:RNA polymerase factor sigma-54 [Alphaproteobacteria bacterium]
MALDIRLEAKLSQNLVMTPRLQQAIKLLQYSHLEMVEHVQEAMLENPTLEAVPDSEGNAISEGEQAIREAAKGEQSDLHEQQNGEGDSTVDWEGFLQQMAASGGNSHLPSTGGGSAQDDLPPIETNLTYGESLADHLTWQLHLSKCNDDEVVAAEAIIGNLDERGYLAVPLDEIVQETGLDHEMVADALEMVQGFDPVGCGARSLSECLIIQARLHYPEDDTFVAILSDHLGNLERRNYQAIARDLELELEDVVEYHKMIVELEPHPGRGYSGSDARYITPDIYVAKHDGQWVVVLNEDGMPDLRISRYYQKVLAGAKKEDKEYILDKLRGAEFLIKSINKRRKTIRRVMESILKFQPEFFERGAEGLRPMVLQDVADDIEVHMSTVSRVTSNKYVHTPHGIYELKYFFTAGVRQQTGGDMSGEAIKTRIKALVGGEDPKRPLSDQALCNALEEEGINVARRTVAKYREALGILPSSKRKNLF